jgi:hypothetical protein
MMWARPVGIGFLMLAVLAVIAIRISPSWPSVAVYAVLGAIAAAIGVALMLLFHRR